MTAVIPAEDVHDAGHVGIERDIAAAVQYQVMGVLFGQRCNKRVGRRSFVMVRAGHTFDAVKAAVCHVDDVRYQSFVFLGHGCLGVQGGTVGVKQVGQSASSLRYLKTGAVCAFFRACCGLAFRVLMVVMWIFLFLASGQEARFYPAWQGL